MTVRSLLFEAKREEREVELDPDVIRSLGKDRLLWVDVGRADDGDLERVAEVLDIPEEVRPRHPRPDGPALRRHQGWVRLTIVAVQAPPDGSPTGGPVERSMIDVIAGENVVVTLHDESVDAIDELTEQLRDEPGVGVLDASALVAALVDEVLTLYLRQAEVVERRIDVLDEIAIRGRTVSAYLEEVVALRRRVAELRRSLAPHRAAFAPLARPDFEIAALGRPWPGIMDRLENTVAAVETARDLLIGSVELHQSSTAQRVNDVMKVLTIVNAVLLPSVVLAGVMGMNFKVPFFEDPGNFFLVLGGMAALAVGTLIVARLRGWL
ncbi:MAG TPA: CorA family divalent cation transporter [Candidatus Limnocylindrales bacterium]|nr:CorA family divalent cation transporter [Candidatus Limnocylindrales bacterium]